MAESQLNEELTKFYVPKEWQVSVKALATSILRLAGCSVLDDTVKHESGKFARLGGKTLFSWFCQLQGVFT